MSTRIGLLSDPHASPRPVAEALALFRREQVEHVLCAGDIAGYGNALAETVELLYDAGCACVLGNHDLWYLADHRGEAPPIDAFLEALSLTAVNEPPMSGVYEPVGGGQTGMFWGLRIG